MKNKAQKAIPVVCGLLIIISVVLVNKIDSVDKKVVQYEVTTTTYTKTTTTTTTRKTTTKSTNVVKQYAHDEVINNGWSEEDYQALVNLWNRESGWNYKAVNKRSGACGIPQAYPCSKMKSAGADYRTNYKTQIKWGLTYIRQRYGSPSKAWNYFKRKGWY